ncbi:AIM24 family protein [Phormidium tenue]|uniref:AIM24 family protein n=1 Tax=Phormidium tenue FACHB-1050 TaxID=2692857 RepID=A0ABR8CFW1_9CYAN|nr:AIM24 family protein [Phormidium tenue]MBD2318830.1 AIM24 family protein [Phormidium tenue FACHB-1050]
MNILSATKRLISILKKESQVQNIKEDISKLSKASNYITRIELQNHPGLIIRPAFIVGISGDIQVRTQWVWSFHSWMTGQHRYIIFYGTGNLYLEGNGGIYVREVSTEKTSVESHLLIGFDSRLGYSTICTETFWPYFRNKVSLIDNQFSGKGVFLRQAVAPLKELTPLEKNFQFISNFTSIVGKFFGF